MNKILFFLLSVSITISVLIGINRANKPIIPAPIQIPVPTPSPSPVPAPPIIPPKPVPPPQPKPLPGSMVQWMKLNKQQNHNTKSPFLNDIVNHLPPFGNQYYDSDLPTWGHEGTHGVNAYVRNKFGKVGQVGFYVGNDQAIILNQPKLTLKQIADTIPNDLRGSRYQLYFVNQLSSWNEWPLYCFDEWVAYTNGAAVGIEITDRQHSDLMVGAVEFSIYALCACVAIDKYDPDYLKTNTQFKEFVAHELQRSIKVYQKGILFPQYQWDTPLVRNVMNNQAIRNVLQKMYGDSLTLEKLFGEKTWQESN